MNEVIFIKFKNLVYEKIGNMICGDEGPVIYLSGCELVTFFNNIGLNDVYDKDFPIIRIYEKERAAKLIEYGKLVDIVNELLSPLRYFNSNKSESEVSEYFNKILCTEGYKIENSLNIGMHKITNLNNNLHIKNIDLKNISSDFLVEQIEKCNKKIREDYDGAITNARSMIEEVLLLIEEDIDGIRSHNNGDMGSLYKRVSKKSI